MVFENLYVRGYFDERNPKSPSVTYKSVNDKAGIFCFSKLILFLLKKNHNPDSFVYGDFNIDGMKKRLF